MVNCSLLNKRMKDKTTMTEDDLCVSTWAIYFACWPVDGIVGGAAWHRLDHALTVTISNFPRALREAHDAYAYTQGD